MAGIIICQFLNTNGQDQRIADSLAKIYSEGNVDDTARLELLRNLSFNEVNDLELSLKYAEELINLSTVLGNNEYLFRGYQQKGNKKGLQGNLVEALEAHFNSAEAAKRARYKPGEGGAYSSIADIYSINDDSANAMHYYYKAIAILRQSGDSLRLATAILNAGDEFYNRKNYDSALVYFKESEKIFENLDYRIGEAYSWGNTGRVYERMGQFNVAEKNLKKAIDTLLKLEDYNPICVYLISMCDIYMQKQNPKTALAFAMRSLVLARQYGFKNQISEANKKLSELYEQSGNYDEALKYYKDHIVFRDSISNLEIERNLLNQRTNYELSQKQVELNLLNQKRKNQRTILISLLIILGLTTVLLGTLYWYYKAISKETKRSENLLLNILPVEIAKELKQKGKVDAVKFDQVTVLFTDFVEFARSAEHIPPEKLVESIDYYYKGFDEITTKYGLEKIKTVGDSYMCASGLPTISKTHAKSAIMAAKEMIELVNKALSADDGLSHFEVRIGIHTGPVVAGIVGIKKWQYDIWGDTVNIASRMESTSDPGRINLSETTYQQIKDEFPCTYRGEIEVKNHGALKMYFLS